MNQKIFVGTILAVIIVGVVYFVISKPSNQSQTPPSEQSRLYTSSILRFKIYLPTNATITETKGDQGDLSLGRIGAANITESFMTSNNTPRVEIKVYSTKPLLEKDFSSSDATSTIDSAMTSLGLKKTSMTINDQPVVIYYGDHIADVPGGGDSWPYVAAEFIGPTYAYMIKLNDISNNPKNSHVMQYLNSFVAN